MKNLKYIVLLLSCLTVISCTKDIDEKEPSNECSILDIKLTGQLARPPSNGWTTIREP